MHMVTFSKVFIFIFLIHAIIWVLFVLFVSIFQSLKKFSKVFEKSLYCLGVKIKNEPVLAFPVATIPAPPELWCPPAVTLPFIAHVSSSRLPYM